MSGIYGEFKVFAFEKAESLSDEIKKYIMEGFFLRVFLRSSERFLLEEA